MINNEGAPGVGRTRDSAFRSSIIFPFILTLLLKGINYPFQKAGNV